MLDARIHRAAFLPALVVLFVVAFALQGRPPGASTSLAADAFSGAFGTERGPTRNTLRELAANFPDRRPGSVGDDRLADRVAGELARFGFQVRRDSEEGDTLEGRIELRTVVGVRPGLSSRRIAIVVHRDAAGAPALAELSATAALLELARISDARDLRKTLELVSTSGGSAGGAGARAWARSVRDPHRYDAVIVVGDLASEQVRKPFVVPWSNGGTPAPLGLRRTVEAAVRAQVGTDPGGARALSQWSRRAVPITISEQGEVLDAGLPAVLLQASGERGPGARDVVSQKRLAEFGRALLHSVTAIDEAGSPRAVGGSETPAAFADDTDGIVTVRKVLPTWAVRLLVGALLLPALVAALDAFFRGRRRHMGMGRWLRWAALGAVPFLLAYAWARVLEVTGLVIAPRGPAPAGALPFDGATAAAIATTLIVVLMGWFGLRPLLVRPRPSRPALAAGGAGTAVATLASVLAAAVWFVNPYAAALALPAAHLWLFAAASPRTWSRAAVAAALVAGLVLPALVALYYGIALAMGPLDLALLTFQSFAGGHVGLLGALALSGFAGCLGSLLVVVRARGTVASTPMAEPLVTRGPAGYAGPGSLGGTESALRS